MRGIISGRKGATRELRRGNQCDVVECGGMGTEGAVVSVRYRLLCKMSSKTGAVRRSITVLRTTGRRNVSTVVLAPRCQRNVFTCPGRRVRRRFHVLRPCTRGLKVCLTLNARCRIGDRVIRTLSDNEYQAVTNSQCILYRCSRSDRCTCVCRVARRLILRKCVPMFTRIRQCKTLTSLRLTRRLHGLKT